MGRRRHFDKAVEMDERSSYAMCARKIKLKSGEASKKAHRFKQRKYECPICGHWHLTSKGVSK